MVDGRQVVMMWQVIRDEIVSVVLLSDDLHLFGHNGRKTPQRRMTWLVTMVGKPESKTWPEGAGETHSAPWMSGKTRVKVQVCTGTGVHERGLLL
jgi:hypothetical protein